MINKEEQKEKSRYPGGMPICSAHSAVLQPSLREKQRKAYSGSRGGSKVLRKLREQRGETLTETMAAMVIVALGGILLVSLVMAANRAIHRADTAYDTYISARNEVETAQTGTTGQVTVQTQSGPVTVSGTGQEKVQVITAGEGSSALYRYIPAD